MRALLLAEVAGDLGDADDSAFVVTNRRDGQHHGDERALLALAFRFDVIDPLALVDAFEDRDFFSDAVRWNDQGDGMADDFGGRITEHALGGVVPGGDDAVEVLANNSVVARFDDGLEPG